MNAAHSPANHTSTGIVRPVTANATTMALNAIQISTGTRIIVHASVSMMLANAKNLVNTLIMRLAHANIIIMVLKNQSLMMVLTSTSVPPPMLVEMLANGDVTLLTAARQVSTSMTLNAYVSGHHTLAMT